LRDSLRRKQHSHDLGGGRGLRLQHLDVAIEDAELAAKRLSLNEAFRDVPGG
jgi:hypothetical protein